MVVCGLAFANTSRCGSVSRIALVWSHSNSGAGATVGAGQTAMAIQWRRGRCADLVVGGRLGTGAIGSRIPFAAGSGTGLAALAIAGLLAQTVMTAASWLTLSRLLVIPGIFAGLALGERHWAASLFLLGAVTDALDGYVARRWQQVSDLGKWLDPLVDKLLVMAPLLALVELGDVPGWGVFLLLARELTITAWRAQLPQVAGANRWGKAKTVSQVGAVLALILWPGDISQVLFGIAVVIAWVSGIIYLWPQPQKTR